MYGYYHCSYTLSRKVPTKILHTLRPHTPSSLVIEHKVVRSSRDCKPFSAALLTPCSVGHPTTIAMVNTQSILYISMAGVL